MKSKKKILVENLKTSKDVEYRFLIIRNGLIGDSVFVTPVIEKLSREYKNSIIDIVTNSYSKAIYNNFPNIHNLFELSADTNPFKDIKIFLSLRKNKYDCILIQEVNTHYSFMAKLTGAKIIIGYKNSTTYLQDISLERKGHAVSAEQILVNLISDSTDVIQAKLYVEDKELDAARKLLVDNGYQKKKLIAIQIACSEKNSIRTLTTNQVVELLQRLSKIDETEIVIIGSKNDTEWINEILAKVEFPTINLAGKTNLRELIAVLKLADLVIGPDTGSLHIANAVETPVVMYMGYADPEDTGPFDLSNKSKVITAGLECIPCRFKNPKPENWEYCKDNRPPLCIEQLELEKIISTAEEILNETN